MNQIGQDINKTIKNKKRLLENNNLLYWYQKSYEVMFRGISTKTLAILEIGSGTSPITHFYPNVKTNDIMPLSFIDFKFDALEIDSCKELEGKTFDIITFSNVMHHLKKPIDFIIKCNKKLNNNGKIIFLEPHFGFLSGFIYKYIHHEATDMNIIIPEIEQVEGPLSTSNIGLPYLIFFKKEMWRNGLLDQYRIERITYFTFISYFLTGGISHKLPIPLFLFKFIFKADAFFAKKFPKIFGTFFILQLSKK